MKQILVLGMILWGVGTLVCLAGCSTSRTYTYSYGQVRAALSERFNKNQWTPYSTESSSFIEPAGRQGSRLNITYYDWEFPSTKVYMEIELNRISENQCEVDVFVKDHQSWWHPWGYSTTLQRATANALQQRMQSGRWPAIGYETLREIQPMSNYQNNGSYNNPPAFTPNTPASATAQPAFSGNTSVGDGTAGAPPIFIE